MRGAALYGLSGVTKDYKKGRATVHTSAETVDTVSGSKLGRRLAFASICLVALAISACAHQPEPSTFEPPGLLVRASTWILIVISFVGSLFTDVRIYSFSNSGVWYDFGFVIGASIFLGGGGASID